ncbi:uncharacterized protein LOC132278347 [Cornus florida]|uniref:uncharacterized protein LOC132278347 n=1 Tax=Cornus florida TaxID=4283 RepID=UPI00289DE85E|nr:uncharacterized protein LOC132278347 [Cornus florida]
MCQAFPTTLKGLVKVWFNKLKPRTIDTFKELSKQFVSHFIVGQRHRRSATYLLTVKQQKGESIREYITRFNTEMLMAELLIKAQKHMNIEDTMNARKGKEGRTRRSHPQAPGMKRIPNIRDHSSAKIQDDASLKWLQRMKSDLAKRSRDKYCKFHRDHGYTTDDYFDYKNQIENLIQRGYLQKFVANEGTNPNKRILG